jgi:hypothetical protein
VTVVTINASGSSNPDIAWERYAVPANWPTWAPQITGVEASAERLAPGMTGRVFGPLGVSAAFVVDAVDEAAKRWAWTVRRGPLTVRLQHGVRANGKGGSATWLSIDAPLPIAVGYVPLAYLAIRKLVTR